MLGAKIKAEHENFIDNFLLTICDKISDSLHKINMTPNIVTTIGFISALLSYYFLYYYKIQYFAPLYILAYFCDCLDGFMARKYKQTSQFGDYYDHFTDITQIVMYVYILYKRYEIFKHPKIILLSSIMFILLMITQGCQEKLMKKENTSKILSSYQFLCFAKLKERIGFLKFFGAGTNTLYFTLIGVYLWALKMKKIKPLF